MRVVVVLRTTSTEERAKRFSGSLASRTVP
jgi:hypothetical protein